MTTPSDETTRLSLIEHLQTGSPAHWHEFCDFYAPMIFRYVTAQIGRNSDVEDVVQEVFRSIHQAIACFEHRGEGSFRGWIFRIAQSKISNHFARLKRQPQAPGGTDHQQAIEQVPDPIDDFPSSGIGPSGTETKHLLLRRCLDKARGEFEPKTWQAFWRTAVEGTEAADLAADLGMKAGAVRTAKCRVLKRIGDLFEQAGG